jgi:hypothetical protein
VIFTTVSSAKTRERATASMDVQNTQMFYFATLATADGRDFFAAAFLSVRLFQMKIEARERES